MRKSVLLVLATFMIVAALIAQTASDPGMGAQLAVDGSTTPPVYTFSWWGKRGAHYFVDTSTDLVNWTTLPDYNPAGEDDVLAVEFTTSSDKIFFRALQFDPAGEGTMVDTDSDGIPDQWEMYYFGSLSRDGSGDWNGDGLLDRDAFRFGLNPKGADNSEMVGKYDSYSYDSRGWLETFTSAAGSLHTLSLDEEGNIETLN